METSPLPHGRERQVMRFCFGPPVPFQQIHGIVVPLTTPVVALKDLKPMIISKIFQGWSFPKTHFPIINNVEN